MTGEIAAGAVAGLTIAAAWLDLRHRTNGRGPLAKKIDHLQEDMDITKIHIRDVLRWQIDHLNDHLHRHD